MQNLTPRREIDCALLTDMLLEEYYEDLVESRLAYLASNGEEVLKDSEDEDSEDEEYDPWEDDGWYDWIDTRQDMILSDLLESCDDVAQ